MISGIAEVLDMLENIKVFLTKSDDPKITGQCINFQMSTTEYTAGIVREGQVLLLSKSKGIWMITPGGIIRTYQQRKLERIKRCDLQTGNIALMTSEREPDLSLLAKYYLILDEEHAACWCVDGSVEICKQKWGRCWKVVI